MALTSQYEPENREIMHEAHRRFGETLMLLRDEMRQEFEKFVDPDVRRVATAFDTRLQSLALIHEVLGRKGDRDGYDTTACIQDLSRQLYEAYLKPRRIRFSVRIEEGRLHAAVCERLGWIVTELVTISALQTSRPHPSRTIQVALGRQGANWILHIADDGTGVSVRHGHHMEFIRSVADAIGGEMVQVANAAGVTTVVAFRDRIARTEWPIPGQTIDTTFSSVPQ